MQTVYNSEAKEVVTTYELGKAIERNGTKEGTRILEITTRKRDANIITTAMVSFVGNGFKSHAFGMGQVNSAKDGDYYKTLIKTPAKRVTEKLLKACHAEAQVCFNTVLQEAMCFYGITEEQYLQHSEK